MPLFAYYARNPEAGRTFNEAMSNWTTHAARAVVGSYPFAAFNTVVDVGGGHGTLLANILRWEANLHGVLFDAPHVVEQAVEQLHGTEIADRLTGIGGDFFAAVPAGGDAYVLSQILHDWDDEHCKIILMLCREVIPPGGKLLLAPLTCGGLCRHARCVCTGRAECN
jgi:O-methyltransferase